jgi:hypothetical protein
MPIALPDRGAMAKNVDELWRIANAFYLAKDMRPSYLDSPQKIMAIMLHGRAAGLSEAVSLQSFYVTQGRVEWYVRAALGKIRASGKLKPGTKMETWLTLRDEPVKDAAFTDKELDDVKAHFRTHRVEENEPTESAYTPQQAKRAKLWMSTGASGKPTQWVLRPDRMLIASVRREHLHDNFSDVLGNIDVGYRMDPADVADYGEGDTLVGQVLPAPPEGRDPLLDLDVPVQTEPPPTEEEMDQALKDELKAHGGQGVPPPPEPGPDPLPPLPETWETMDPKGVCPDCERGNFLINEQGHRADCKYYEEQKK